MLNLSCAEGVGLTAVSGAGAGGVCSFVLVAGGVGD